MSTNLKPHVTKKTAHASDSSHDASHEAGGHAASPIPVASASATAVPDFATAANAGRSAIRRLAGSLTFYDPSAKELIAARVANRVPVPALQVAAGAVEQQPDRYQDFDADTIRSAADYVTAMTPLMNDLAALRDRLGKSIFNRHGQGASETLALYQTVKGLARVQKGKDSLALQKSLAKAMVKTRKKNRATSVTDKELKGAAKGIRASKKAAVKTQQAATVAAEAQTATAEAKLAGGQTPSTATSAQSASASTPVTSSAPAVAPVGAATASAN